MSSQDPAGRPEAGRPTAAGRPEAGRPTGGGRPVTGGGQTVLGGRPTVSGGGPVVLGIETSCDETAAAVVDGSGVVRSSVVSSQVDLHAAYGGVVPELASRAHLELIGPVVRRALEEAGLAGRHPDDASPVAAGLAGPGAAGGGPMDGGPMDGGPAGTGPTSTGPTSAGPTSTGPVGIGHVGTGRAGAGAAGGAGLAGRGAGDASGSASRGATPPAWPPVGAVAATVGPGLVGALLVGASHAKGLALAWDVPFVGVNHLEGHCFAALVDHGDDLAWPLVVLLVSGGHTMTVAMDGPGRYRLLGQTLDDAAGEAFDKVARFLGLGYPGGPAIEKAAAGGDPTAFAFPRAMADRGLDLSFSGLKTAVVNAVRRHPDATDADVAASFQQAVVDVLVRKAMRAAESVGAGGMCLAGGVAANGPLRAAFAEACRQASLPFYAPSRAMCTDNAAMVAAAGAWQLAHLGPSPLDLAADPAAGLPLGVR